MLVLILAQYAHLRQFHMLYYKAQIMGGIYRREIHNSAKVETQRRVARHNLTRKYTIR